MPPLVRIGTAGWSIPRAMTDLLPGAGTHLQRYGRYLHGAEINSSFHRPHTPATYARWAASVPDDFRFAVKLPRTITHDRRLVGVTDLLVRFLEESAGLADRRGPLLVQLPPSLALEHGAAGDFFGLLRSLHDGAVACEPRHESWFSASADALLQAHRVARVAADPPRVSGADQPGGWPGLVYYRLHGSPRVYWSRYEAEALARLAAALARPMPDVEPWCIFDNTASGAALENAWELSALL